MKYKVYAIQSVKFNTLEFEANSEGEAIEAYNEKWYGGVEVFCEDYRGDKVQYIVEAVREK